MRQRESRYFIDLKQIFIERSQVAKNEALTNFICSCVKESSEKITPLSDQELHHLSIYVGDYVGFILQKKILLQKELKDILFDSMICLKAVIPNIPELPAFKSKESRDYESIVEKNIHYLQALYHLKNDIKEDLKKVFASPYEYKFFYQSKYPYKEQILRSLVGKELPEILPDLGFQRFSSMGNKDYIVTAEPRSGGYHKLNLIYYSSSKIPVFRKLTFETEMNGFNVGGEISCLTQLPGTISFIREAEERPSGSEKPVRIGYIFDPKKFGRLQADEILTSKYPVEFVPIDLRVPLNREIDGFVHKITNQMKNKDDVFAAINLYHFEQISKRDDIRLFDPMDSLNILSNRDTFQNFVGDIFKTKEFLDEIAKLQDEKNGSHHYVFDVPKACFIDPSKSSPTEVLEAVKKEGMKYPIIVKTATAGVDKNSHKMAVALNEKGLYQIEESERFREYTHILQEYIEHDERIYKVYAIGNEAATEQKQSLPNLLDKNLEMDLFYFDSQASIKQDPIFSKLIEGYKPLEINHEMVQAMCRIINKELKLSLVGFDLIKGKNTGAYYLVDINYFPSCKPFKDFRGVIHKLFYEECRKK